MKVSNSGQNNAQMNDVKVNPKKQNRDPLFKTFDRPYLQTYGRYTVFDPDIETFKFGENYKLAVNQLMKKTTRKSFARKLTKTVIELLFEELASVFWVKPNKLELQVTARTFETAHRDLSRHYNKLSYDNANVSLNELVFVQLNARYIRYIGTLSSEEKLNWHIKPSVNRKLSAKIRGGH